MSAIDPTNNTSLIIDDFINYANAHLSTVGGVISTISLYPPLQTPGPGIINWTGYTVQPSQLTSIVDEFTKAGDDLPVIEGIAVAEHETRNNIKIKADGAISPLGEDFNLTTEVSPYSMNLSEDKVIYAKDPGEFSDNVNSTENKEIPPAPVIYGNVGSFGAPSPPDFKGKYTNGNIPKSILVGVQDGNNSENGPKYLLHAEAASQYFKLKQAAKDANVRWVLTSAYRTAAYQQKLKSASDAKAQQAGKKESTTVAKAGSSSHGWGIAIDIGELYRDANDGSGDPSVNKRVRQESALYRWLSNNAPKYGWYNPYRLADNRGTDECWHWEYWGFYTSKV